MVNRPRSPRADPQPASPESEHIPAHIRRAVWERDHGCCQWRLANGDVCGSQHRVQYDHVQPRAKGGATTIANLRLLCQRHNLFAARMAYGEALMRPFRRDGDRDVPRSQVPLAASGAAPEAGKP